MLTAGPAVLHALARLCYVVSRVAAGGIGVLRAELGEQSFTLLVTDVAWSKRSRIAQADSHGETVRQSGGDYALSIDQIPSMLHLGRRKEGRQAEEGEIG